MQADTNQFITFKLGRELYAISVSQVREVLDVSDIIRVPGTPAHVRGIVSVRGQAIPVIDLHLRFGLEPIEDSIHTRIIVIEIRSDTGMRVFGGIADSVHEVIELERENIIPPPTLASGSISDCIKGMGKRGGELLIVLDMKSVLFREPVAELA